MMVRIRQPLRQVGKSTQRWHKWRFKNYGLLAARARGICEGCGRREGSLDAHHVFGRDTEPVSSHISCLAGLCRDCHKSVTGEVGTGVNSYLRRTLEIIALVRLKTALKVDSLEEALTAYSYDAATNSLARVEIAGAD